MTDQFQQLLEQLGKIFHLSLHPDKIAACSILIPPALIVQLEMDPTQENLFLFSKLIEIPPGKFRENVLGDALKANASPDPVPGVLAYLDTSNCLVLFQTYPIYILNGDRLAGLFGSFFTMAENWRKAIASGNSSPSPSHTIEANPFGLR